VCVILFEKINKITHVGEGPASKKKIAASAVLQTHLNSAHGIRREDFHDIVELLNTGRILEGLSGKECWYKNKMYK
jgi:hypothetical protein